jgi:hypothetical protein
MTSRVTRSLIDYFVLDALANDLESLEDVLRILNSDGLGWRSHHADPFTKDEVVPSLYRCLQEGLVHAAQIDSTGLALKPLPERALPAAPLDDLWFALTAHGRLVHGNWDPPPPSF